MEILLFEKHLQKQAIQPRVGVPVDKPQIVAGNIVAKIGKLDALSLALAAPLPFHAAAKNLAADQLQPLPRRKEWKKALWTVKKSKLAYSIDGETFRMDLPEMTAWRGAWYVNRL